MQLPNIPIINYHKIESKTDIGITSRHPEQFRADLQLIKDNDFQPITFTDIIKKNIPSEKPLIITFDDGYESVFTTALPMMREYGFKGVVFLPVNYIGEYNNWDVQIGGKKFRHLSESQIKALYGAGFEIGSHAASHRLLNIMSDKEILNELTVSRAHLSRITGTEVTTVSYPFGRFNERILRLSEQAGYKFGVAALYFRNVVNGSRHLACRRYNIYRFDSPGTVRRKLNGKYHHRVGIRDWLIQKGGLATVGLQYFKRENP